MDLNTPNGDSAPPRAADSGPAAPAPQASRALQTAAHQAPSPTAADPNLLDELFKLAEDYRAEHALRQAMEMYFELAESHAETPQGAQARQRLLAIARCYEQAGNRHQARSIYERLL